VAYDGGMARRVASFDGRSEEGRRYPWSEWADGSPWEIRRGEDYDVATENMRVALHMKGKQLACKVQTRKFTDDAGEGLVFQFLLPKEGKAMSPTAIASEAADLEALYQDIQHIYETARREVTISRSDGTQQKYAANRFKQQMDRAYSEGRLISAVASTVERRTQGFEHLENAERDDLMLETYVLDESKPYHHLFSTRTLQAARERMADYYRRHPRRGQDGGSSS
jgi:hypothetical protein